MRFSVPCADVSVPLHQRFRILNTDKMKRIMIALTALLGLLTAHAYEYPYLVLQTTDGTVTAVGVESLTLTVSDGTLTVTNSEGTTAFTLTDLSKMYFSTTSTGIDNALRLVNNTVGTSSSVSGTETNGFIESPTVSSVSNTKTFTATK
jgi:hypothetical protein